MSQPAIADLKIPTCLTPPQPLVEWRISREPQDYPQAVAVMEARVAAMRAGTAPELVWLLSHPSLYTAGTSAKPADLLEPERFPVYVSGRGGQYTYHGPGQRVAYVLLNLHQRDNDIRAHVWRLEEWAMRTAARFGVVAERRAGRIGVWVSRDGRGCEAKLAAIGVRVRGGVTYHGLAFNVCPDLAAFGGIVPCGLSGFGVTSLADLGVIADLPAIDEAFAQEWSGIFG